MNKSSTLFNGEMRQYVAPHICMMSLGGDTASQNSSNSSQQGFRDLPSEIQNAFKDLAVQAQGFLPGNNPNTTNMFTPLAQTAGETNAINNTNQGFTPDAARFASDIKMQQNPFDQSVIDTINREAQGAGSQLNRATSQAGQFGSNRFQLGANDIDLSRLQQIGAFKQGQYNTAANNALTVLPGQRMADASAQLATGGFQRQLAGQTKQAPISALQSVAQILGILPTNSGQSSGQSNSDSFGFKFGIPGQK